MKKLFLLFFCTMLGVALYAQTFTATSSKSEVANNGTFRVTFKLNSTGSDFKGPDMADFRVLSGPNPSSQTTIINNQVSQSISYWYELQATKEGEFTIGSATIVSHGKTVSSNELEIKVVKGNPNQKNSDVLDLDQHIFVRCFVSKSDVYQGEQFVATYKLYTDFNSLQYDITGHPDFQGFWSQEVDLPGNPQLVRESYNGKTYHVAKIKQVVLFPQRSGELELGPLDVKVVVRTRVPGNRPLDRFWGRYRNVEHTVSSIPLSVPVKALPEPQPQSFSGMVGSFELTASVSKTAIDTDEGIDLDVEISGEGNVKQITALDFDLPSDFEAYDPELNDRISVTAAGMSGRRNFKQLLIPRHPGDYTIPAVEFSYFDPVTQQYNTLRTDEFAIAVGRGSTANSNTNGAPSVNREQVVTYSKDIRYIKPAPAGLEEKGESFFGTGKFYGLMGTPVGLLLVLLFAWKRVKEAEKDTTALKGRRATKVATKRLRLAQKKLQENDSSGFYAELLKGLYGYVSDKLNIPVADLSRDSIAARLSEREVQQSTIDGLIDALDRCEMAKYAPVSDVAESVVYETAENIVNQIEREVR